MATYTYTLIPGGYTILRDGQAYIYQDFIPGTDQQPYADGDREAAAQAAVTVLSTPPAIPASARLV